MSEPEARDAFSSEITVLPEVFHPIVPWLKSPFTMRLEAVFGTVGSGVEVGSGAEVGSGVTVGVGVSLLPEPLPLARTTLSTLTGFPFW